MKECDVKGRKSSLIDYRVTGDSWMSGQVMNKASQRKMAKKTVLINTFEPVNLSILLLAQLGQKKGNVGS